MQKNRLYFIDIARSIAILLMLEGHFYPYLLLTKKIMSEGLLNLNFMSY